MRAAGADWVLSIYLFHFLHLSLSLSLSPRETGNQVLSRLIDKPHSDGPCSKSRRTLRFSALSAILKDETEQIWQLAQGGGGGETRGWRDSLETKAEEVTATPDFFAVESADQ